MNATVATPRGRPWTTPVTFRSPPLWHLCHGVTMCAVPHWRGLQMRAGAVGRRPRRLADSLSGKRRSTPIYAAHSRGDIPMPSKQTAFAITLAAAFLAGASTSVAEETRDAALDKAIPPAMERASVPGAIVGI